MYDMKLSNGAKIYLQSKLKIKTNVRRFLVFWYAQSWNTKGSVYDRTFFRSQLQVLSAHFDRLRIRLFQPSHLYSVCIRPPLLLVYERGSDELLTHSVPGLQLPMPVTRSGYDTRMPQQLSHHHHYIRTNLFRFKQTFFIFAVMIPIMMSIADNG